MRTSKPVTITFCKQQTSVDRRMASGNYDSVSEVVRAAVRALDREEAVVDELMREKLRVSLADPRPDIDAEDVFARLRAHHDEQAQAGQRDT